MYLISLTFWNCVLVLFALASLGAVVKIATFLATLSERVIALFTQSGMHQLARTLLALSVGYDQRTYGQSRFLLRNQVHVRFRMLWGSLLALTAFLGLLRAAHVINSVILSLLVISVALIALRMSSYFTASRQSIHQVKEQSAFAGRPNQHFIRQWDYLDELFAA